MPGFGGLFVLLFAPYIADGLGRKVGTAIGCIFVLLGVLLQAFPPAGHPDTMYLIGRFIMGFGSNISNGTCPLLITEVAHPRHRGKVTTIVSFYAPAKTFRPCHSGNGYRCTRMEKRKKSKSATRRERT
jgi:MFS family permease